MPDSSEQALNYYRHRTVLVTGAGGFLGSHLVDALLQLNASVIGVDNFITGRKINLAAALKQPRFQLIEADVIQAPATYLGSAIRDQIELIFHFASPASPPRYQEKPVETYLVNSYGTHQLLHWLKQTHPQARFVFASSSEVYGDPQVHPQPESYWGQVNPNGPRACYDEAKRLGETICGVWQRNFQLDVRIARFFNTYGPRLDPDDGRVISNFIKQAQQQQALTIYGEGTQTRSYCYVSDLIQAVLLLGALPRLKGKTFNLGNPEEYSVRETAKIIWQIINPNKKLKLQFRPFPQDDPTRRQPNIDKAKRLLGWQPKIDFQTGIKLTLNQLVNMAL